MSAAPDDGSDVLALAHKLGLSGFRSTAQKRDQEPAEPAKQRHPEPANDALATLGRAVGLKTGMSLVPEKPAAQPTRPALAAPAAAKPVAAPIQPQTAAPAAPGKPVAMLPAPTGHFCCYSGEQGALDRFQVAAGLPSQCFHGTDRAGTPVRAWKWSHDPAANRALAALARQHGLTARIGPISEERFRATGIGANNAIPAATLSRLRTA